MKFRVLVFLLTVLLSVRPCVCVCLTNFCLQKTRSTFYRKKEMSNRRVTINTALCWGDGVSWRYSVRSRPLAQSAGAFSQWERGMVDVFVCLNQMHLILEGCFFFFFPPFLFVIILTCFIQSSVLYIFILESLVLFRCFCFSCSTGAIWGVGNTAVNGTVTIRYTPTFGINQWPEWRPPPSPVLPMRGLNGCDVVWPQCLWGH